MTARSRNPGAAHLCFAVLFRNAACAITPSRKVFARCRSSPLLRCHLYRRHPEPRSGHSGAEHLGGCAHRRPRDGAHAVQYVFAGNNAHRNEAHATQSRSNTVPLPSELLFKWQRRAQCNIRPRVTTRLGAQDPAVCKPTHVVPSSTLRTDFVHVSALFDK